MFASVALAFLAATSAPPATQPSQPAKPVKQKKICMPDENTGSIMPKRVCRTQTEWEAHAKETNARSVERPMSMSPVRAE